MKGFEAYFPVKLVVGAGKIKEIGKHASKLGKKACLVYDPFLKDSEVIKNICNSLKEKGIKIGMEYNKVVPNPRHTDIDEGAALCKKAGCDFVIGVGGGSAMDTAKGFSLVVVHGGSSWDYTNKQSGEVKRPTTKGLPILAVPTTAGTGSEATLAASIVNLEGEKKLKGAVVNPVIFPDISIVDAELMYSKPAMLTAHTGLDAFAHAFESYVAVTATEFSEMLSLKSMELFVRSIRKAVKEPKNKEAREDMALSSTLGGASFCQASLCLPHAIAQPVSALTDAPHGATLAICLPYIIEWTLPYGEEKFAKVAELFDPSISGLPVSEKAKKLIDLLEELYNDLGINVTYNDYGMNEEDIKTATEYVFDQYVWDIEGHPKKVTREAVEEIYRKCL